MKGVIKIVLSFIFLFLCITATAQSKNYSTENAHSHNDYLNPAPFFLAFTHGFGSIEADVFPVNGILYVAHKKNEIQSQHTLKNLYLNPLLHKLGSNKVQKLSLLVDVKEDYKVALPLLIKELEPLKQYLSAPNQPNYLTIIVSGNRPPPAEYKNYPGFIFFDDDLKLPHADREWQRVALVSLPFNKISGWKGEDKLRRTDRNAVSQIIDSVHTSGKRIRFWAAPDTKSSWKWQMKLGTDLIGTDKISELGIFLKK